MRSKKCPVYQFSKTMQPFFIPSNKTLNRSPVVILLEIRIKTKSEMLEEFLRSQGFNHIMENILINLDVISLWKCRLVCKALHQFTKLLENSKKLKKNDFKIIRRIRWKNVLAHSNWNAAFNSICKEDNFYRRRGLIDLLEKYDNQEEILTFDGPITSNTYLNSSKFLIK